MDRIDRLSMRFKYWSVRVSICVGLGLLVAGVSHNLGYRLANIHESVANQFAILEGHATTFYGHEWFFGAWSNRVMFPMALAMVSKLGLLSQSEWFMLLRIASAILGLYVFAWAVERDETLNWRVETVGLGVLSLILIASFTEAWEIPTDFLDVIFISAFLWSALERRRWTLLLLALIATTNRESAAFAGVIWAAVQGVSDRWRPIWHELIYGVVVSVMVYAAVLIIRYELVGPIGIGSDTQTIVAFSGLVAQVRKFLSAPTPIGWPTMLLIALGLAGGWLAVNRMTMRAVDLRLVLSAIAIFCVSLIFANINEIRPFLPSFVILVFVAVGCEARRWAAARPADATGPGSVNPDIIGASWPSAMARAARLPDGPNHWFHWLRG